jgi:serine/threonine protein kinase/tetratricopeptide (TPR) repeat protein
MSIIGKTIAHYEITSLLGKGGMGEVYEARDRKLGRSVAIKVLPAGLADDPSRVSRFHREAKLLALLNHPNIAAIHSMEESDGTHFLVLELVEGTTLADRLKHERMPAEETLKVALQIAEALEFAHDKGVIHRDLKPANVKITPGGRVKVLDFGLAKALDNGSSNVYRSEDITLTNPTTETRGILGTAAYMSPEQASGLKVDGRSDIWAFGVVVYEMLAGKRPFQGKTIADTLANVLHADIDWSMLPDDTPEKCRTLLRRCLTRDRKERLQAIGEARIALRECLAERMEAPQLEINPVASRKRFVGPIPIFFLVVALTLSAVGFLLWRHETAYAPGTGGKTSELRLGKSSIAVLPFVNMSSDGEQEYFCDGLTEEMITRLSQLPELKVTARTSAFAFKGENRDIREVGRRLGVDKILEGSVRRDGNRLRISAQLINVSNGFHLWSETYDRDFEKIFRIQDDIAVCVARALKITLLEQQRHPEQTENFEAYNEFLLGQYYYSNPTKENLGQAVRHYERAIDLDPKYAKAWAALAATQASQASFGYAPVEGGYQRALASVRRALALDDSAASAHAVLGWIQMTYNWDWTQADTSFRRALELESGNGLLEAAHLALVLGRMDRALQLARQAVEVDALNDSANMTLALTAYYAGLLEEASDGFRKVLKLNPDRANAHALLAEVFLAQSRLPEALAEVEKEKDPYWRLPELSLVYFALGRKSESDECLVKFIGEHQKVSAFQIAQIYAFRGEVNRAFEWLEKAYSQHDGGLFLTKKNPLLQRLNPDPRFAAFLRKMNLPTDSN